MPQFRRRETFSFHANNLILGSSFFTLGLFKKTVLADHLALLANPVFSIDPSAVLTFMEAWIGVCAYAFQIYFDFSGYSDMAIRLGLIFGIRLPANFESPYRAASIIDFWRRWHMTLSRFLRDYVYIPLGGNRRGKARRYLNLMLTMLLGGLWHGAAWAFVVWGVLHGLYLCLNHAWLGIRNRYNIINTIPAFFTTWAGRLLTFAGVCIAWTFFRTEEIRPAMNLIEAMSGLHGIDLPRPFANPLSWLESLTWSDRTLFRFDGSFAAGIYSGISLFWIVVLLPLVFLLPNTRETLTPLKNALNNQGKRGSFTLKAIFALYGTGIGIVSFVTMKVLMENTSSEFIYLGLQQNLWVGNVAYKRK